jgi:hypothetical protein
MLTSQLGVSTIHIKLLLVLFDSEHIQVMYKLYPVFKHNYNVSFLLDAHMIYVSMMLCRIFGKKSSAHFLLAWVPIMHEVAQGFSFNWAKILSDNLAKEITKYQSMNAKGKPTPFYMPAYIMDAICFMTPFPLMIWS